MAADATLAMRQYLVVTLSYWAFTLTDGALRMLVVLHFYQLGYSALAIAMLFVFYELFGVVTNLAGGWIAARLGLAATQIGGLILQAVALAMLLVDPEWLSVGYVMLAQALSGVAKDLNKMSAKSGVKLLLPDNASGQLFRWVAWLTGSKNLLKGLGFFLGGVLLSAFGFRGAVLLLMLLIVAAALASLVLLDRSLGRAAAKPAFTDLFSKSAAINRLSAARLFLFGARDVWFVIALPVFLQEQMGWSHTAVGTLLALWIIGYGMVQMLAPVVTGLKRNATPGPGAAVLWGAALIPVPLLIAWGLGIESVALTALLVGLTGFALLFAINSALHSYLVVALAQRDGVTLDVGFYYMANASGRLLGTVLSGWVYQRYGLPACLLASGVMLGLAVAATVRLHQLGTAVQPRS